MTTPGTEQTPQKVNLLGLDADGLATFFTTIGEKPFRAAQVLKWIHQQGVDDFAQMSNISKDLRAKLAEVAEIRGPQQAVEQHSDDGTIKWALRLDDGQLVETVFIPDGERGTLCVSSQVGCIVDCAFCSTAQQGFNRNLTTAEIIGQLWHATRMLGTKQTTGDRAVSNVVFMGMGEPLLNVAHVVRAAKIMLDDNGYGLSKRRVTISTSGIVPGLEEVQQHVDLALALSLHAPNNELRNQLVPVNKKYPLEVLLPVVEHYVANSQAARTLTVEYVMLAGVNDSDENAHELAKLLKNIPSKINLIPFNPFPQTKFTCSSGNRIAKFAQILIDKEYIVTTRRTRGDDIDAACGQLVGKVNDRSRRTQQKQIPVQVEH